MISRNEAQAIIGKQINRLAPRTVVLHEATGLCLAADLQHPYNTPPFRQSAMDGYAIRYQGWDKASPFHLVGEVAAGKVYADQLKPGEAVRIFTGAAVPDEADTVVMQEKVRVTGDLLYVEDPSLIPGMHIRPKGSQGKAGEPALAAGSILTPAAIGYLASVGLEKVNVYPPPRVGVIVTGSELLPAGALPEPGKVYESNSGTLRAALHQRHIVPEIVWCPDDPSAIESAIHRLNQTTDLLLITGGISVGDYDFVFPALTRADATVHFHKVKQKPAKPLCFATLNSKPVFALPGNPASVLTCYYAYVLPALNQQAGVQPESVPLKLPLAADFVKKPGLTFFLKGRIDHGEARLLGGQESYRMDTFALADILVVVDETVTHVNRHDLVEVIRIA